MYVCKLTKRIFQHYSIILELNNEIDSKILYIKKKKKKILGYHEKPWPWETQLNE